MLVHLLSYLDTVVADGAMRAPWWSVELARDTPLHPDGDTIDLYVLVEGCPKVIVLVFVGLGPRDHPRVHERGQAKVHHHEQGDQALVHQDQPPVLLKVPSSSATHKYVLIQSFDLGAPMLLTLPQSKLPFH